jgi:hypothetical protein
MPMTHYMELLATNQPWNLILFMGVPVVLAETVAITELYILFTRRRDNGVATVNRAASIAGGFYFAGVFLYLLMAAVVPLTASGTWRGPADVIAVSAYLSGIVPLLGLALIDVGAIGRRWGEEAKLRRHAALVAVFLVVAHVAMIFGMLDPTLLGAGMAEAPHPSHGG